MLDYTAPCGTAIRFGDDLRDVEHYLATTPRVWSCSSSTQSAGGFGGNTWDFGAGYDGAMRMAREGWSDGAADLHLRLSAMPAPINRHADLKWGVAGHRGSVPRYLAGNPMHMVSRGKRTGSPPVIHLIVNISASGATTAEAYKQYGTAVAAMVQQLEARNHRVELDVADATSYGNRGRSITGWKVKRADQPLDLAAIAFSIGHPAALRRLSFALQERLPKSMESPGYGMPASLPENIGDLINARHAIHINGIGTAYFSGQRDMLALAARQINEAAGQELVSVEKE